MDYQKLYSKLFNGITDTIEQLKELQIQAEEDYLKMSDGTTDRKVIPFNPHKTNSDASQETYLLVVDDDNYNKLLSELYVGEWHEPEKSVLDNVLAKGNDLKTSILKSLDYVYEGIKNGNHGTLIARI